MFKSFKTKLVIGYTLILVFILVLFSAAIYTYAKQQTYSRIDQSISHRLEQFENNNGMHFKGLRGAGKGVGGGQTFLEEIVDSQGKITSTSIFLGENEIIIDEATLNQAKKEPVITNSLLTDDSMVRVGIKKIDDGYFVSALPLYESEQNILSLGISLLVANVIFIIIALATGIIFVSRALKPIKTITEKANEISSGDLSQRVNLKGPKDELKKLADAFDKMIEKLDNLFKGQKNFFADISHELKTPLTIARGEIDVALRNQKATKDDLKNALKNAQEELEKMTSMVNDLLSLARDESYKNELAIEKISAKKFLQEIIDKSENLIKPKSAEIHFDDFKNFTFRGDKKKLQRLFLSLIDNATKHVSKRGTITLKAGRRPDFTVLSVSDNGAGIPKDDIPHIFERFYKGEKSTSGGTGLGLAIAKNIAEAHGGKIEVESIPDKTTTFSVYLPINHQSSASSCQSPGET